ncbi:unnamed protein product [Mytilus edulis]|uniref:Uncharacterized protein n=1 Tax=Mytilus edulis TaxID=6550 RepID=A0A8S3R8C9_MYTED|nr:unnamed protein product [Mytilus edulis]
MLHQHHQGTITVCASWLKTKKDNTYNIYMYVHKCVYDNRTKIRETENEQNGVITLAPRNVPWENEQWTLECSLDSIVSTVSINNPSTSTVGTCDPTSGPFPASCTPTAGYTFAINETSNIVSMTLTVGNSETGTWTCLHSTDSPGSSLEDISTTSSPSFTCTTKSAYMSTIDTTATILQSVNSVGTKLKVSVYVAGYYNLPSAAEYTYDVTFAPTKSK